MRVVKLRFDIGSGKFSSEIAQDDASSYAVASKITHRISPYLVPCFNFVTKLLYPPKGSYDDTP